MADNPLVQNILIFQEISKHPAELIAQALQGESDGVLAAVIARFNKVQAKEILLQFPLATQRGILTRMSEGVQVPGDILAEVLKNLHAKLEEYTSAGGRPVDGAARLAEILRKSNSKAGDAILDALRKKDPNLAGKIKDRMFVFTDIPKLNDQGLAKALGRCDNKQLAMSLKGAEQAICDKILKNLSPRRRQQIEDERKNLGPRKRSEVDEAQTEFVKFLRGQIEAGVVFMDDAGSDGQWVV